MESDRPEGGETKRELGRLALAIKVRVSCASADAFSVHFSENLSKDGVFVRSTSPKPIGSTLEIEYVLQNGLVALRAKGVVRWVRGIDDGGTGPSGMGVQLTEIDEAGQRFLCSLLAEQGAAAPPWVTAMAAASAFQPLAAPPATSKVVASFQPLTDSRQIEQKLALVMDLSGPDFAAALLLEDDRGVRLGVPTKISPRLLTDDEGLRLQLGGVWVPCLMMLASFAWPSPHAAAIGRRLGLLLGGDGQGGVALMIDGQLVRAKEALAACMHELVAPYANSEMLPEKTHIVVPPWCSAAAVKTVAAVLAAYGSELAATHSHAAVTMLATAKEKPVLVVAVNMLETFVSLVQGGGRRCETRSVLDTGLWRVDELMADRVALKWLLARGPTGRDESSLRGDLSAAVAGARLGGEGERWSIAIGDESMELDARELRALSAGASTRVLLACEALLCEASVMPAELCGISLIAEEPVWPGLLDAISEGLLVRPAIIENTDWCRIEGVGRAVIPAL